MPSGLAAGAALRARLGAGLPAVLITADHTRELAAQARQAGISLLNKPLKPAALRALLSRLSAGQVAAE